MNPAISETRAIPITPLEKVLAETPDVEKWPAEFAQLNAELEADTDNFTLWLGIADWLKEHDEPTLAKAYQWVVAKTMYARTGYALRGYWSFRHLPDHIN